MKILKVVFESVGIFEGSMFSDILWFEAYFRFLILRGDFLVLFLKISKVVLESVDIFEEGLFSDILWFEAFLVVKRCKIVRCIMEEESTGDVLTEHRCCAAVLGKNYNLLK